MEPLISLNTYPVKDALRILIKDKTTKQNIIFATDNYLAYGDACEERDQMTVPLLTGFDKLDIQPRVMKSREAQQLRTRVKAEVMTPAWIVCKMNAYCDEDWFGRQNVFETLDGTQWTPTEGKIEFPEGKTWRDYVDSRRLEITCGEAPYIVSRYDTTTGELIPIGKRTGLLDRKLRVVTENAADETEWLKWTDRAFQSVYGYEWQGDNLLIARINLLCTFTDYLEAIWHRQATKKEIQHIANIIVWNFWQMDAFTGTIPYGELDKPKALEEYTSYEGAELIAEAFGKNIKESEEKNITPPCLIRDWRETGEGGKAHLFTELSEKQEAKL